MQDLSNYSKHTIFFINNTSEVNGEIKEKYLLYYDEKWKCYLFPNVRGNTISYKNVKKWISSLLNIYIEQIKNIQYIGYLKSEKNNSEGIRKKYYHDFTVVTINNFLENQTGTYFGRNNKSFRWMSLKEMKDDKEITIKNSDIIEYLEEYIKQID